MKLIVGIGNPGKEYENTRHSVGFEIINNFKTKFPISNPSTSSGQVFQFPNFEMNKKFNAEMIETEYKKEKIILVKPQTYMNNSGEAIKKTMDYYKIKSNDLWVVCDDLDLELGTIRIRKEGSSGGHKGLQSIIDILNTDNFIRFKIGIGSNRKISNFQFPISNNILAERYVLQKFSKDEQEIINKVVDKTVQLVVESLETGIEEKTVNII